MTKHVYVVMMGEAEDTNGRIEGIHATSEMATKQLISIIEGDHNALRWAISRKPLPAKAMCQWFTPQSDWLEIQKWEVLT